MYLYELETVSKVVCYYRGKVSLMDFSGEFEKKKGEMLLGECGGGSQ